MLHKSLLCFKLSELARAGISHQGQALKANVDIKQRWRNGTGLDDLSCQAQDPSAGYVPNVNQEEA